MALEASLILQGLDDENDAAFVPVEDYFALRRSQDDWQWAAVSPFIEGGTLADLAQGTKVHERSPQKLDQVFRPAFNSLLQKLGKLHAAGCCHDDLKPDNVFVANTTHWLLGDLGNVRHIAHPWHATGRWKRENQKPDCKEKDLRRMLKTYMTFIKDAAESSTSFDTLFYAQSEAWSKLYWTYVANPVSAQELVAMSKTLRP